MLVARCHQRRQRHRCAQQRQESDGQDLGHYGDKELRIDITNGQVIQITKRTGRFKRDIEQPALGNQFWPRVAHRRNHAVEPDQDDYRRHGQNPYLVDPGNADHQDSPRPNI